MERRVINSKRKSSDSYKYTVNGSEEIRDVVLTINKYPNIDYIYIKKYWMINEYMNNMKYIAEYHGKYAYFLCPDLINLIIRLWYSTDLQRF